MNDYSLKLRGHPQEVIDIIKTNKIKPEDHKKIRHMKRRNGAPCSEDLSKDACMYITWNTAGNYVYYYCHRCNESGRIYLEDVLTPDQTTKFLEYLKTNMMKENTKSVNTKSKSKPWQYLPTDFKFMKATTTPEEAISFLKNYNIDTWLCNQYDIGWSNKLKRIIIPIYSYIRNGEGNIVNKHLIGWAGRCISNMSKEKRKELKRPKWTIEKIDKDVDRLLFLAPRNTMYYCASPVVYVEDIFSAIRVCTLMKYDCYALLTNYIPYSIIADNRAATQLIWLDNDMKKKAIEYVKKFKSLGFRIAGIYSEFDPKCYAEDRLIQLVNKGLQNAVSKVW